METLSLGIAAMREPMILRPRHETVRAGAEGSVYGFVQSGTLRARKRLIQRSLNTGRTNEEPSVFAGFASQGIHERF
jgi:hypothetical protein